MTLLNVVDVEATCWEGEPPAGQRDEIIEIGIAQELHWVNSPNRYVWDVFF